MFFLDLEVNSDNTKCSGKQASRLYLQKMPQKNTSESSDGRTCETSERRTQTKSTSYMFQ